MVVEQVLKDFQDHLAPRLDTYEQSIYLYLLRHSRLIATDGARARARQWLDRFARL